MFILIDTLINKINVATWAQVMYIQVYETQLWNLESVFDKKKMIIQNKQDADQSDIFLIDLFIRGNDAHKAKSHLCPIQKAYLVILEWLLVSIG